MQTSALFGAYNFKVFEIHGVSARARGFHSADTSRTKEVNF